MVAAHSGGDGAHVHALLLTLDLCGTFVFALSGASAGVRRGLDLFGVLVISFAAANAGGIARDVLIGSKPLAAIADWRYIAVSFLAGLITFLRWRWLNRLRSPVLVFDAAGLALFAVAGALKAQSFHLGAVAAIALGVLTAVGGGIARDLLVAEVPVVLRADIYAVAALAGAAVVVLGDRLSLPLAIVAVAGAAVCFALRLLAIIFNWRLPVAQQHGPPAGGGSVP